MTQGCVTLDEVFAAAAVRAASLVPETSGYLALAIGDATSRLPFAIDERLVMLTTEGNVGITKRGEAIHPSQLLWLATEGSARTLHLEGVVGRLGPGAEADLVVLDLASTPAIAQRVARADGLWDAVFPTIMMGDDRAVRATWVSGRPVRKSALKPG